MGQFIVTIWNTKKPLEEQYQDYADIRRILDAYQEPYSASVAAKYTDALGSSQPLYHGIRANDERQAARYQVWLKELIGGALPGRLVFIFRAQ